MEEKLIFKPISLNDKDLIESYLKKTKVKSYEYTFTTLYMWRNLSNIKYTIIYNTLILLKYEENKGFFFMMPCGYTNENLTKIVDCLYEYKKLSGSIYYLFGDIEEYFIKDLKLYTSYNFDLTEDTSDYEYIYNTSDLIKLEGKKYHSKRNHCSQFKLLYNYRIKDIDSEDTISDCINLLNEWHIHNEINSEELKAEIYAIEDLLYKLSILNLNSIAIYVGKQLVGFSIGESHFDTAIIQVERCNTNYKGIYSFINNEFLIKDFSNTIYVNREEDCGSFGLRKAKKSYHPVYLLNKYLINIIKKENE